MKSFLHFLRTLVTLAFPPSTPFFDGIAACRPRECRSAAPARRGELRARASLEKRTLTDAEKAAGYIGALRGEIPFNSDSVTLTKRGRAKPFVEQIAPDAFKRSIAEDKDIMANAGHTDDPLAALGRIGENLTVTTDARSLKWEALVPNTRACADMLVLVDKGIIRGTSFEFEVRGAMGEKWETRDANLDQRTILDARLIAFNPVTWPAYSDSSLTVEMRRAENRADRRDSYYGNDIAWDATATADQVFAVYAFGEAVCGLTDALEYLRASPAGALVPYAQKRVADSAAAVTELAAWLAANGAQVDPAYSERAKQKLAEARAAVPAAPEKPADSAPLTHPDHDRERRLRILKLRSAS